MADPALPANTPPRRGREALVAAALALAALGALFWWVAQPGQPGSVRVEPPRASKTLADRFIGDAACIDCHAGQTAEHARMGHSRTFRPAADRQLVQALNGRSVVDPEQPDTTWNYRLHDGRLEVERRQGDRVDVLPIEYAFGSGSHATTFVSIVGKDSQGRPTSREHRLTYYAATNTIDITPAQQAETREGATDDLGRLVDGFLTYQCFHCHVTLTSATSTDQLDPATMIPSIGCERCHGPARAHVELARSGATGARLKMPFGPESYTAPQQMKLCGACHRHPDMAPAGALVTTNPELARFQPAALMQSKCYLNSAGKLSCTTCHDPHTKSSTDLSAYAAKCLSCHGPTNATHCTQPNAPADRCTTCHMPRVDAGQGIPFAHHWIQTWPDRVIQSGKVEPDVSALLETASAP